MIYFSPNLSRDFFPSVHVAAQYHILTRSTHTLTERQLQESRLKKTSNPHPCPKLITLLQARPSQTQTSSSSPSDSHSLQHSPIPITSAALTGLSFRFSSPRPPPQYSIAPQISRWDAISQGFGITIDMDMRYSAWMEPEHFASHGRPRYCDREREPG